MVDGVSLMVSHPGNTSEYFVASGHSSTNHYSCLCSRIGATYMYTGVVPLFINDKYFCKEGTVMHKANIGVEVLQPYLTHSPFSPFAKILFF